METNHDDSPATARDLIAWQLKRLRDRDGLSLRALADELTYSHTYLGDIETGRKIPTEPMAQALDSHFNPPIRFTELLESVREMLVAAHVRDLLPKLRKAVRFQSFASSVIPGLLQTPAYAHEQLRLAAPTEPDAVIAARVEVRMARKAILDRDDPPLYWAVIDEAALLRSPADPAAMREQLDSLERAAARRHITLQVHPLSRGMHGMLGGSLTLLALSNGGTTGLIESFGSGEIFEAPKKISRYTQVFDVIRSEALTESESLELIRRYKEDYEDAGHPPVA
jgi:transcriptional regulator with XRE-family HTH domain